MDFFFHDADSEILLSICNGTWTWIVAPGQAYRRSVDMIPLKPVGARPQSEDFLPSGRNAVDDDLRARRTSKSNGVIKYLAPAIGRCRPARKGAIDLNDVRRQGEQGLDRSKAIAETVQGNPASQRSNPPDKCRSITQRRKG